MPKYEVEIPFTGYYRLQVSGKDEEDAIETALELACDVDIADIYENHKLAKATLIEEENFDDLDYDKYGNKIVVNYSNTQE